MGDLDLVESGKMTRAECEQYLRLLRRLPAHRKAMELMDIELRYQALDAIQFAAAHHEETMGQLAEAGVGDKQALTRIRNLEWSEVMRRVNRMFDEQIALHRSPDRRDEPVTSENTPVPQDQQQQAKALIERATAGQAELIEFMAEMYFNQVSLRSLRNVESRPKMRRRVVKAGLAAELYRFEHGAYPKSLEPLKPLVDEPLVDALNGKPIQLKKLDKGVLIYALGLNGTDDGGVDIGRLRSWSGTGPTPDDIAVRLEQH